MGCGLASTVPGVGCATRWCGNMVPSSQGMNGQRTRCDGLPIFCTLICVHVRFCNAALATMRLLLAG